MIYAIIIIIVAYFILIVWLSNGIIKHPVAKNKNIFPNVSIIVSAHNEEDNIENLIKCLVSQAYPSKYQIIIANDRSNDKTQKIIQKYKIKYNFIELINIQETPIGWGNKKWALNQCIEKAKYNMILQTDADCMPKSGWVESMIRELSEPDTVFVSGPAPMTSKSNPLSSYYKLDSLAQDALSAAGLTYNLVFSCTGRNIGFQKTCFMEINGYENIEHYKSGDDDLLIQKFASLTDGKIVFSFHPNSVIESAPPSSINQFFNQRIRYASKSFDYYKLDSTLEFKLLLPFLYTCNIITLISLIIFIQNIKIIYLIPLVLKSLSDYCMCSIFFDKINEKFSIKTFIVLAVIHPIYVSSLGILSPFINYNWKENV